MELQQARSIPLSLRRDNEHYSTVLCLLYHDQGGYLSGREVTAVQAARATAAVILEVQEVGPIETPGHEDTV